MGITERTTSRRSVFRSIIILSALFVLMTGVLWLPDKERMKSKYEIVCTTDQEAATMRGLTLEVIEKLHSNRGLTNQEICTMSESRLDRAIVKAGNPKPDHPDEAVSFRLQSLRDEAGIIPTDGYSKAAEQIDRMRAYEEQRASGLDPASWTWLGPGNIGGRIRSIVIHPTNPQTMWVGAVSGGIWKTTDGGASWQPEDDFMANLAVGSMVMDPTNPSIIYAGTGEGFYNGDAIRGAGVFKTVDGGANWDQLPSTTSSDWHYVNRMAVSPDGSTVLAATRSGIYRSINGGTEWTQRLAANVADIDFNPADNNKAVAGSRVNGLAYYSIDGGQSWLESTFTPAINGASRVETAYAPGSPGIVFASVAVNGGELWKSVDGGQNYALVNSGTSYLGSQGWYDNVIWVDPTNANNVIVGGIDLWRSSNGGASLVKISQWSASPASAHADHHVIIEHPGFDGTTNKTVFFGNDGGIYKADDVYTVEGTNGWQELNNNLGITQFYGAAGNADSGIIVGGTQDNGTLRFTGDTEEWDEVFGGDGGWSAADPNDANYFYGEYIYLTLHRSTNGGGSAQYIYNGISEAGGCANFIAPFILDPNDPNTLLAGGCSLWRSNNVKDPAPAWTSIKPPLAGGRYQVAISAVAAAEGNSDLIWIGHNNGRVYKTTNGSSASPTWEQMDLNTPNLPDRWVLRITIDPRNHDIVYVTFGGFSTDNVWRTADGGATWSDVTGSGVTGLPDVPVRSLVIDPDYSEYLYVGTEVGIFASEDSGQTWSLPQDGPANVSVDELFWMDNKLVAATHGRGLFEADVSKIMLSKTAVPNPVEAGSLLTYDFEVKNRDQKSLTEVTIIDPLPSNTTYVSGSATCGGSEAGGVVTFALGTMNGGDIESCSFQVIVDGGLNGGETYFADDMESGPSNWSATAGSGSENWTLSTASANSPTHAWFAADAAELTDQYLALSAPLLLGDNALLSFEHYYNLETSFDGGVVEISTNGTDWSDLGPLAVQNGYNGAINDGINSPIAGRSAFTGDSGGFLQTIIDLSSYSGQEVLIRFRLATDESVGDVGWYVDDVLVSTPGDVIENSACVVTVEGLDYCHTSSTAVETAVPRFVQFNAASYNIAEDELGQIDVTLNKAYWQPVEVQFEVVEQSAAAGDDYEPLAGTLIFDPGETNVSFNFAPIDDDLYEGDETVELILSDPLNAALGTPMTATLTIEDNEVIPTVQFAAADVSVDEDAGQVMLEVTLSGPSAGTISVDVSSSDGTAVAGDDYTAVSTTLTYYPTLTSQALYVLISPDEEDEADENFYLTLSNPNGAQLGETAVAAVTILDVEQVFTAYMPTAFKAP